MTVKSACKRCCGSPSLHRSSLVYPSWAACQTTPSQMTVRWVVLRSMGYASLFQTCLMIMGGGVSTGPARDRKRTVKGVEYTLNLLQNYFDHAVIHWRAMAYRSEILLQGDCKPIKLRQQRDCLETEIHNVTAECHTLCQYLSTVQPGESNVNVTSKFDSCLADNQSL